MYSAVVWVARLRLTVLEHVRVIDNIVFISMLPVTLRADERDTARTVGLSRAMFIRIALLLSSTGVMRLTQPLFGVFAQEISGRDLILIGGGLFLIAKRTHELHDKLDGEDGHANAKAAHSFAGVIVQIL